MLQYLWEERESYNPPLLEELGSAQQKDTDPAQTHLDLALHTPDFQGDTVWILTETLHLRSLPKNNPLLLHAVLR